jgi:hypothetical protein
MAATFHEVGRIFVVRWIEPTVDDLNEIRTRLKALGAKLGKPPVYIAITPAESTPPTDSVRKEMLATMGEMSNLTESLHLVLEGSGLKFSALRSIVASMFLIGGNRKTHVHDSLHNAIAKARLGEDEAEAVREALNRAQPGLARAK